MNDNMTVRTDGADPDTATTDPTTATAAPGVATADPDDDRVLDPENDDDWEVGDLARPEEIPDAAPRRFMLREYPDEGEPTLFMWGVEVPDGAIGFDPDGSPVIRATSAERTLRLFGMTRDLDLLWLDPPPAAG